MLPDRYVPRKISEISRKDRKVSIVGRVFELNEGVGTFVIEDDNGKIEVLFEKEGSSDHGKVSEGKVIRAFCMLVGDRLKLDFTQGMGGLDLNLLKTVDDLYKKAGI